MLEHKLNYWGVKTLHYTHDKLLNIILDNDAYLEIMRLHI